MNINWWIRNIRQNYCISEFKCNLNSNRLSSQTCNVFRVIIILYTIDLYVVLIPQNDSKWNKIVSIQTMSNPKNLCLPPIANTLRDLDMRFTWVHIRIMMVLIQAVWVGGSYVWCGGCFADIISCFLNIPWKWYNLVLLIKYAGKTAHLCGFSLANTDPYNTSTACFEIRGS